MPAGCKEVSSAADGTLGLASYACGCQLTPAGCTCAGGVTPADLEPGCIFDAKCNVRCVSDDE